jgi:cell wall-associated NlpC family hydrolase
MRRRSMTATIAAAAALALPAFAHADGTGGVGAGSPPPAANAPAPVSDLAHPTVAGTRTKLVKGVAYAPAAAPLRVKQLIWSVNTILGKPYVYGGGHSGWGPQQGYDCSGFVSAVLHAGGYLSSPVDTTALPSQAGMESGPGQNVTIYDRAQPGQSGHVIIEINGQFYESGGMHGAWGGGGGVQKIAQPSASYLSTFETVLHPAGL